MDLGLNKSPKVSKVLEVLGLTMLNHQENHLLHKEDHRDLSSTGVRPSHSTTT